MRRFLLTAVVCSPQPCHSAPRRQDGEGALSPGGYLLAIRGLRSTSALADDGGERRRPLALRLEDVAHCDAAAAGERRLHHLVELRRRAAPVEQRRDVAEPLAVAFHGFGPELRAASPPFIAVV